MTPAATDPAALLDLLPVTVARFDPDLRLAWANARLGRVLGVDPAAVVGRTCAELGMDTGAWGDWAAAVRRVLAGGPADELHTVWHAGGADRVVLTKFAPVPGPDGRPAGVLAVAVASDEVRRLRDAMAASDQRFQAFMDHLPGIAWLRDADERYLFVNRQYLRVRAATPADYLGKHPTEVYPPAVAADLLANDARVTAGGPLQVEERVPDAAGVVRTWVNAKFTVPGPDGRPQFAGVGLDVTAERAAEQARRELEAKILIAQKAESLGVLAAGVAHDFNNILTAVMGFAGLGRELARDAPGPVRDCFAQIETAAERAADLCRQMLAYAGHNRPAGAAVDLSAVARETVRLLAAGHLRGVAVDLRLADPLPAVRGDPTELRQVVLNLLTNAAEATAGRPDRTVRIVTDAPADPGGDLPPGRYVRLAVTDTGAGMDPATAARAFEPFFTTKFAGRGLGLAAVDGIVRHHRGTVRVTTAPDQGSTFEVLLPAVASG